MNRTLVVRVLQKIMNQTVVSNAKNSIEKIVSENLQTIYHGSSIDKGERLKVKEEGLFDGVFGGSQEVAESHGDYIYKIDLKDSEILEHHKMGYLEKTPKLISEELMLDHDSEDFDLAFDLIVEDKFIMTDDVDSAFLKRVFHTEDPGDASWEVQRLRGVIAKKLGYKAVEMDDEHGTSYLIMAPAILTKASE